MANVAMSKDLKDSEVDKFFIQFMKTVDSRSSCDSFKPDGKAKYFNQQVERVYGYQTGSAKLKNIEFTRLSYQEFSYLLYTADSKLTEEQVKSKMQLCVRVFPRRINPKKGVIATLSYRPFLSVFNTTSYSLPFLVNLFSLQGKVDHWKAIFKTLGLKPKALKSALQMLRLGYHPLQLFKILKSEPGILDNIPGPHDFSSFNK